MDTDAKIITFEELCMKGRDAREQLDKWRWIVGDLALLVASHYGDNQVGEFAKHVGLAKNTIYRYRRVSEFYNSQKLPRGDYLAQFNENIITWSHCREAMRDSERALFWLRLAQDETWTVDQLAYEIGQYLKTQTNPPADAASVDIPKRPVRHYLFENTRIEPKKDIEFGGHHYDLVIPEDWDIDGKIVRVSLWIEE